MQEETPATGPQPEAEPGSPPASAMNPEGMKEEIAAGVVGAMTQTGAESGPPPTAAETTNQPATTEEGQSTEELVQQLAQEIGIEPDQVQTILDRGAELKAMEPMSIYSPENMKRMFDANVGQIEAMTPAQMTEALSNPTVSRIVSSTLEALGDDQRAEVIKRTVYAVIGRMVHNILGVRDAIQLVNMLQKSTGHKDNQLAELGRQLFEEQQKSQFSPRALGPKPTPDIQPDTQGSPPSPPTGPTG